MRKFYLSILFVFSVSSISAQNWESGITFGATNYLGDLAPELVLEESHPALGLYLQKNMSPYFSWKIGLMQGKISGNDQNFDHLEPRNLAFESSITEANFKIEFNFFPFLKGLKTKQITPFVHTGIALFRFNPKTELDGETYELRKYSTEGQDINDNAPSKYELFQPSVPIGGGIKVMLGERFYASLYASYRATFTDFVDDVSTEYPDLNELRDQESARAAALSDRSNNNEGYLAYEGKQRGNPQRNDWYIFSGLKLSYAFRNDVCYEFD